MSKRCLGCMEVFGNEFEVCPHCGYVVGTLAEEAVHLEPGSILHDRYVIGKVLGFGGFGVTYIAWDGKLEQKVAVKEYLPGEFATRMPGRSRVTVFNGNKSEQFHDGLKKFVDEALKLAKFQNEPGIVKVFDSFEENDTAYIIMEYLDGETLTSYLKREGMIPEDKAVEMLMPVMESLKVVHKAGLIHRDIAPDNIFLTKTGEVKLIDFGASRFATTSHSRSLTVIIKPGYSPEEQYRSKSEQGSYTDVYALAATLYKTITGRTPPDAMERRAKYESKNKDILEEPHKINKKISLGRENAILNAMNVRIEDRTQDVETFIEELNANPPVKRRYGKIKKIDVYSWPLWVKIAIPAVLSLVLVFGILLLSGVIRFSNYTTEVVLPENYVIVPDVEGLTREEAVNELAAAGLLGSIGGNIESQFIQAGKIVMQSPVGGAFLQKNSKVNLTICSGQGVISAENGEATVPFLIGDTKAAAMEKLKAAGLGTPDFNEVYDDNVEEGKVVATSIESGEIVEEGTVLTLSLSIGPKPFAMPDLVGKQESDAKQDVEEKGLSLLVEYENNKDVPVGNVIRQSVAANTNVRRGDQITIVVSSGDQIILVSDVVGKTKSEAEEILKKQGFSVYFTENVDEDIPAGSVISQSPEAGSSQKEGATVTVTVSSGKKDITVSFDSDSTRKTVHLNEVYGTLPTPSKTGYTFQGWRTATGTAVTASTKVTESTNHTLYAAWEANKYQVGLNVNGSGATVSKSSLTVVYDAPYSELPTPSRTGYGFLGWFTAASDGDQISQSTIVKITSAQTLYAHWKSGAVTVSFNGNGGLVSESSKVVTYDGTYGTLKDPVWEGHTFKGWYTAASDGSKVTSSTKVTNPGSHTLYAQWEIIKYTLSYNANGSNDAPASVSPSSKSVDYGAAYGSLPTPTRTGYEFLGWYTAASGGAKVNENTLMGAGNVTIYAHWTAGKVTVAFNANGGTSPVGSASVTYSSTYGTLPTPTRAGYDYIGWFTSATGGTQVTSSTKVTTADPHTLYARWREAKYTVSFNANGGSVSTNSKEVTYGSTYGDMPTPNRSGYSFNGWFTSANGGTKIESGIKVSIAANQTLYAQWVIGVFTLYFDANGGSVSPESRSVAYGSQYGSLPTPTRTGYSFVGWYTSASGGSQVSATTTMGAGNVTIYAHWSQNSYSYTVQHLSSNGTVLGTGSVTHEYGSTYTISPNSYSGYTSPAAQTVTWDSTQKTIVFYYTPVETSATTKTGSLESYLTYSATVEHRNRTANSIQIRVVWTTTIKKGYYIVYGERFTASSGGVSTGTVVVLNAGTWKNSASSARTATGTSDWITVPVSGTDITQINLAIYFWQVNYNDTNMTKNYGEAGVDATWSIAIPKY